MSAPTDPRLATRAYWGVLTALAAFAILRAALAFPDVNVALASGDNDDMMRLMSVRDWLAGQGWFDMVQHRMMPPGGLSMHWSRYVDAGIAALLVPASQVVPGPQAEAFALVAWPTLLLLALLGVVGSRTRRMLGPVAAIVAMVTLFAWLPIAGMQFLPGRIDHHNAQILAMTVLVFAMIGPGKAAPRGMVAALAAAVSLAVGLETLPLIAVAAGMIAVRAAWRLPDAEPLCAAFCVTLGPVSLLLFAGQTAPADWLTPHCDALAPPVMGLAFVGSTACLIAMAVLRRRAPVLRLLAMSALAGFGLWLLYPLLEPCLGGPYGQLPERVRHLIATGIGEAQPALLFGSKRPASINFVLTPALGALFIAAFLLVRGRGGAARGAVMQMVVLALVGIAGSIYQIRMMNLAAPTVPFLMGFAWLCLWEEWRAHPSPRRGLAMIGCAFVTLLAPLLNDTIPGFTVWARDVTAAGRGNIDGDCRTAAAFAKLDALPPARILTPLDMGAPLILLTHHTGLAAPYHRSEDAFSNGVFTFDNAADMREALARTQADYVLLCASSRPGPAARVARDLLSGTSVAGLHRVAFAGGDWVLFAPDATAPRTTGPMAMVEDAR